MGYSWLWKHIRHLGLCVLLDTWLDQQSDDSERNNCGLLRRNRDSYGGTMSICPHCTNWAVAHCDDTHCDIAGPGAPGDTRQCRVCWLRLGGGPQAAKPVIPHGPGAELVHLLLTVGISGAPNCACKEMAAKMNAWGVAGCREHRAEIVEHIRAEGNKRGWLEKTKAAALALKTGLAFQLDMSDLYGSLVGLAIKRAESHP